MEAVIRKNFLRCAHYVDSGGNGNPPFNLLAAIEVTAWRLGHRSRTTLVFSIPLYFPLYKRGTGYREAPLRKGDMVWGCVKGTGQGSK